MKSYPMKEGVSRRDFIRIGTAATASVIAAGFAGTGIGHAFPPDCISDRFTRMCYHENPVGPHPAVYESLASLIDSNRLEYYSCEGHEELKNAILRYNGVCGLLGTDNIGLTVGSTEALMMCAYSMLNEEATVLTEWPTYGIFFTRVEQMGSKITKVPLVKAPDGRYLPDLESMKKKLSEDPSIRIVHFNMINNPMGSYMRKPDFDAFVTYVSENFPDIVIIADDSDPEFRERIPDDQFPKPVEHVIAGRNCIHVQTFSHIFGITGLRLGYYIAPSSLAEKLETKRILNGVSITAVAGGIASLQNAGEQIERAYINNHEGRLWLYSSFEQLGIPYLRSHGAYIMLDTGIQSSIIYILMAAQGVMIRQGSEWGLDTFIRVNPGMHPTENEIFIKALINACHKSKSFNSLKDVLNTPEGIRGIKNGYANGMLPDLKTLDYKGRMAVYKNILKDHALNNLPSI
jgi:histidinol-phosphate aminotransferase